MLQAQPATLASLVGALNLCSPTHPAAQASLRALGEEECSSISTPPQVEHARPVWTQSLLESGEASSSGDNHLGSFATPATLRSAAVLHFVMFYVHAYDCGSNYGYRSVVIVVPIMVTSMLCMW